MCHADDFSLCIEILGSLAGKKDIMCINLENNVYNMSSEDGELQEDFVRWDYLCLGDEDMRWAMRRYGLET